MKKILFISHYFPPEVNAPATRTYEHATRWATLGYSVTIITNFPNHPTGILFPGYKNKLFFKQCFKNLNIIRVKTYLTPNKGTIKRSINFLIFFFIIKIIKNIPFILEVRDLWPDSIVAVGAVRNTFVINILIYLEKRLYISASRIITVTEGLKRHIIKYGYFPSKISTITNGVDFNRIEKKASSKNKFQKEGRFLIVYIGTFGLAHALVTVLDTARLLRDYSKFHFLLIGDGADQLRLLKIKEKSKLNNVTILPIQPKKSISYFLSISDVGIVILKNSPLFQGALPSKMFEYMAKKKPIIVSVPEGEATGIAQKYNCGLAVQPENPAELKRAILKLYHDPDLRVTLGENGYSAAYQFFNRDSLARKMLALILDVC
jgi:glycosyltransferase involved in cell wall biosynthesis